MKKLFLFILVLAALSVFCSAAFAQTGYVVPTLETVRRDGSTVNVFTYRDANGNKTRVIEYYVNDDGSYGNVDQYYGASGLLSFSVQTDYKNGVCTVAEQSISYSANDLALINSRETTFNPDGKVNVSTSTLQELENGRRVITGMETDGQGRKIHDFKEERYTDSNNDAVTINTVYNPDKTVDITKLMVKPDGSKVHSEGIFDENDKQLYSLYISYDPDGKEVYSAAAKYTYSGDGRVSSENLIDLGPEGKQLRYIEKWDESGSTSTAEGELLDKNGNKLADYSFEKTYNEDGSEVRVDTYVYPDGRVDIISNTADADGNFTVQQQLDFKAAGEETGETPDDDAEYEAFYEWGQEKLANDIDEPDDELIRYFEDISDIWGENIVEDFDHRGEGFFDELENRDEISGNAADDVPDDVSPESDAIVDEAGRYEDRNDEIGGSEDWDSDESDDSEDWDGDEADDSEDWDEDSGGSDSWGGDSGGSDSRGGDSGGSDNGGGDSGGSDSWGGDSGGSDNWGGDDGGSDGWDGDDGGSDNWGGDDGGSDGWDGDDGGSDGWDGDDSGSED